MVKQSTVPYIGRTTHLERMPPDRQRQRAARHRLRPPVNVRTGRLQGLGRAVAVEKLGRQQLHHLAEEVDERVARQQHHRLPGEARGEGVIITLIIITMLSLINTYRVSLIMIITSYMCTHAFNRQTQICSTKIQSNI